MALNFVRPLYYTLFCLVFALPALAQRLPTGQTLHPAGHQIALSGSFPMSVVTIPGMSRAVVTSGGALQGLSVVNMAQGAEASFLPCQALRDDPQFGRSFFPTGSAFYGLAVSRDGRTIYASHGGMDQIGEYALSSDTLTQTATFDEPTGDAKRSNFPAGIALSRDGMRLYAANNLSDTLAVFDINTHKLLGAVPVGGYPLSVAASPDNSKVYVAAERDGVVSVVDPLALSHVRDIPTGSHPNALFISHNGARLYVANAGSDTLSLIDTRTDTVLQTLLLRPAAARGLPCATPTSIAVSADDRTLYITLADLNAVAVVRLNASLSDGSLRGLIPSGWYPSAIAVLPRGTLCIINAKGSRVKLPNPSGPGPVKDGDPARYIHDILTGTMSIIPVPKPATLAHDTRLVLADNSISHPLDTDAASVAAQLARLPIRHVLYIIKENRTYDQVLGDVKTGNGDPSLVLFGRTITPNQHALAENFVLLDNFYACAEVSSDGWNWSTSGFANDYVQRTVPENYSERKKSPRLPVRPYDYEGENRNTAPSLTGVTDMAESPGGYIWDAVMRAGLTLRNYGCFLTYKGDHPTKPALVSTTCLDFAPFGMRQSDSDAWQKLGLMPPGQGVPKAGDPPTSPLYGPHLISSRYTAWKQEFDRDMKLGSLPVFSIIRLPRDHTQATDPAFDTPQAMVADNDFAVGEIVDAVSHSPFWASTAIFIVEDDAQNGPDHVDCHRTTAFVVSPFIRRGSVDHHFYNTDSLLRTMELVLHLPAMTRYDATAPPIRAFSARLNLAPYVAILPPADILNGKNPPSAYKAALSHSLNFTDADAAPDTVVSEILWHAIKGEHVPMPAIRRTP